ncbi:MAG TPA: DUF4333 domain-containing protein [Lacisediminihabitans sp.]|uniref:DUF4333 domain-containing protein n=1 Tax=Lacisediminihabitans sp. TaxID=2787631 RepID=UPI002EDA5FB1
MPLLQLGIGLLLLFAFPALMGPTVLAIVWVVPYLAVVGLAALDTARLGRAGHAHPAHWAIALLSAPVYLIARAIALSRVGGAGVTPLVVWVVLGLLQFSSVLAVPGLLISALPSTFRAEAERSIVTDAAIMGVKLDVSCPQAPPTLIGQRFSCSARDGARGPYDVTVSLQRVNGWIDWRVDDWGVYTSDR